MIITHIIKKRDWAKYKNMTNVNSNTLKGEGFIHCSNIDQVCKVADSIYMGEMDLLLLFIDSSKLIPKVVWEDLYDLDEKYPHIYGCINTTSIVGVYDFIPNKSGHFVFSKEIEEFIIVSK